MYVHKKFTVFRNNSGWIETCLWSKLAWWTLARKATATWYFDLRDILFNSNTGIFFEIVKLWLWAQWQLQGWYQCLCMNMYVSEDYLYYCCAKIWSYIPNTTVANWSCPPPLSNYFQPFWQWLKLSRTECEWTSYITEQSFSVLFNLTKGKTKCTTLQFLHRIHDQTIPCVDRPTYWPITLHQCRHVNEQNSYLLLKIFIPIQINSTALEMKCEEKKWPTKQLNSESSDAQAIPTEKGFIP